MSDMVSVVLYMQKRQLRIELPWKLQKAATGTKTTSFKLVVDARDTLGTIVKYH